MTKDINEKIVFAVSPDGGPNDPLVLLLGIPEAAWNYIHDGRTNTFDLTKIGLPLRLVIYGAKTHDEAMKKIEAFTADRGITLVDKRREDFSIKTKDDPNAKP